MQNKYLAMTPPMGWNSWNTFTWNINEDLVCGAADALCASGLKDKGYEYVVIDDCWSLKQRDENGRLVPDPEKFPHGMKAGGLCALEGPQVRHVLLLRHAHLRGLPGQL